MGIYINPSDDRDAREKASKIAQNAKLVSVEDFVKHEPGFEGVWGVAVVDNGMFIAAGVAYSKDEAEVFSNPNGRDVAYYLMHFDKMAALDPIAAHELRKVTA